MNRQIQKPNDVHAIEAVYYSVTSWNLEDLVGGANHDMNANYQLGDVEGVSVRYNDITVYFKDGEQYEEEGGYDHDIDWKEPRELLMWTEDWEEIPDESQTSSPSEDSIMAELLDALEHVLIASEDGGDMNDIDWNILREAIAKAKGEKQ